MVTQNVSVSCRSDRYVLNTLNINSRYFCLAVHHPNEILRNLCLERGIVWTVSHKTLLINNYRDTEVIFYYKWLYDMKVLRYYFTDTVGDLLWPKIVQNHAVSTRLSCNWLFEIGYENIQVIYPLSLNNEPIFLNCFVAFTLQWINKIIIIFVTSVKQIAFLNFSCDFKFITNVVTDF